jgi:hypothetical protein
VPGSFLSASARAFNVAFSARNSIIRRESSRISRRALNTAGKPRSPPKMLRRTRQSPNATTLFMMRAKLPDGDPEYKWNSRVRSWPFWCLLVIAVSGPWFGVVGEPQWERVTWIPFLGFEDKPADVLVNFLLFVPFGWSFVKTAGPRGTAAAMAAAAALSVAVEIPQLFYRLRDPSATDVLMAVCGAGAGSVASQAFHRRDTRGAPGGCETSH